MSEPLLILIGLQYLGVAAGYALVSKWGSAVVFTAYAAANVGLIFMGRGK